MESLDRPFHLAAVRTLLDVSPVVALLGSRQVGKTTLARMVAAAELAAGAFTDVHFWDLEDPADRTALTDPRSTLAPLRGLVILDEIQRMPGLFELLRVLADRPDRPARFLVLGSASPVLLRQSSETLAGRIAFHELPPFRLDEVGADHADRLWLRGGLPRSFLAPSAAESVRWRRDFVRTFVERDLPQLGGVARPSEIRRLWAMLGHAHGDVLNASGLGRSLGTSHTTVRRWIDLLEGAFAVRVLRPWHANLSKRQVKSPKVFVVDTGVLHSLLQIETRAGLLRNPKAGASWESFCAEAAIAALGAEREQCFFWGTHASAELDLVVSHDGRLHGFEMKRTSRPAVTRSMRIATEDLGLSTLTVIHAGERSFQLDDGVRAVAMRRVFSDVSRL